MHPHSTRHLAFVAGTLLFVLPAAGFEVLRNVTLTPDQTLRATLPEVPTSAERIVFPGDQSLSVSFVHEYAGGSHALGWLYYDDLVARGYVDPQGTPGDSSDDTLVDANGNGIADLHEDLYNLAPASGPQARPYIGRSRRCYRPFFSGGFTYSEPELAINASCTSSFTGLSLADARPGTHPIMRSDIVGSASSSPAGGFSDNGLFPRIPNLLEPTHSLNDNRGLGKLVFLLADDDTDLVTYKQLGTVADTEGISNGIPDYDVSAYDAQGLPRAINPNPGITEADRTVDLGLIPGGRELVFFLIVDFEAIHNLNGGMVYPCLRKASDGQCTLHLQTPISVFFTKAKWNLDQDPVGQTPVVARNIGCDYDDPCARLGPDSSSSRSCPLASTGQKLCGWLEAATRQRLDTPAYGFSVLAQEAALVPMSGNGNMPHALLSAPSTTPGRWMLGFEDLNGGGDRDFNDVLFMFHTRSESSVRSRALGPDDAG